LLRESYYGLKKQAAREWMGEWQEYGQGLEARLSDLHGSHRGRIMRNRRKSLGPEGTRTEEGTTIRDRGAGGQIVQHAWERFSTDLGGGFLGFSTSGTDPQPGIRPERQPGSPLVSGGMDALWVGMCARK